MARGHRLNTSIVLAAVHGLSGLFRAVSAVEPITLALFPTLSPSLIGHPASVDVKQHKSQRDGTRCAAWATDLPAGHGFGSKTNQAEVVGELSSTVWHTLSVLPYRFPSPSLPQQYFLNSLLQIPENTSVLSWVRNCCVWLTSVWPPQISWLLNPFTVPAGKCFRLKDGCTDAPANSIYIFFFPPPGPITSTFNAMRFDGSPSTCQCENENRKA